MAWHVRRTSRIPANPKDEPDNVPERLFERAGQVSRRPGHARASTIVQVEEITGAAQGPDGYMHPHQQDGDGSLYVTDAQQVLLDVNRNLRLIVFLLAKLADHDDPFEIELEQADGD